MEPTLSIESTHYFLYYAYRKNGLKLKTSVSRFHSLILSRKFLRSLAHTNIDGKCSLHINAITFFTNLSIYMGNIWIDQECPNAHIAAVWAELIHPVEFHLHAVTQDRSRQMQKSYAELCKTFRDINSIKKISLYLDNANSIENRTLIDGLPLAPIEYSGCADGPALLSLNSERPRMPSIELKVEHTPLQWTHLLSANVEKLSIIEHPYANDPLTALSDLPDYFPLKPNPGLKHLELFASMLTSVYEVKSEDTTESKADDVRWHSEMYPRYKEAFRLLYNWNPDLKIGLSDSKSWIGGISCINDVIMRLNGYFRNVMAVYNLATEATVNLASFSADATVFIKEMGFYNPRWIGRLSSRLKEEYPHLTYGPGVNDCVNSLKGKIPNTVIEVDIHFVKNGYIDEPPFLFQEWNEPAFRPTMISPSIFDDDFEWDLFRNPNDEID